MVGRPTPRGPIETVVVIYDSVAWDVSWQPGIEPSPHATSITLRICKTFEPGVRLPGNPPVAAVDLVPGTDVEAEVLFWADEARTYASIGASFEPDDGEVGQAGPHQRILRPGLSAAVGGPTASG